MKSVTIKYSDSGLNSNRLILNAIVDIVESSEPGGIVEISPENHFEDILKLMQSGLTYKVDAEIMEVYSYKNHKTRNWIQAFIG